LAMRRQAERPSPSRPSPEACDSPSRRRVKNAVDLHDIVVKQALDLDHRARRIGRLAPQLRLHLVHHGREAVQVADVNSEPHTILQARALRLRNQPDIEESLANSGVGILHQCVGRRIDALHAGDKDEVTGPGAETPGTSALMAPGGLSVLTPLGEGTCAKLRLDAMAIAVTQARASRGNIWLPPS